MLQVHRANNSTNQDTVPEFRSPFEPLANGVAFVRRHLSMMFVTCSATIVLAILYLIVAVPTFTATAQLIMDSKAAPGDTSSVSTIVESQIAIIRSEGIARVVVQKLGLTKDPEFSGQGLTRRLKNAASRLLGWRKPDTEYTMMRYATDSLARKLSVRRVGSTYIVETAFDSSDPERAAQILSAIVDTYIMGQMDARYRSALQNERWMSERSNELSNQAAAAKQAVADYEKTVNSQDAADAGTPQPHSTSAQAELRELQAAADTATRTYDNFVRVQRYAQRYMEAMQQQALQASPAFEARLLTDVSRPLAATTPKAGIVLGVSAIGGLILGIALGMLRDLSDRGSATAGRFDWRALVSSAMLQDSKPQFDGSSKIEKHLSTREPASDR